MKKKLLFLTAWLLTAANAETWAQKTVTDFAGLKQAVGIVKSIPTLQKNVDDKKTEVTAAEDAVTAAQRTVSERELAVKEKEAIVTEKTKAVSAAQKNVDEKKAAVVPLQVELDGKKEITEAAKTVVGEWEKNIRDLEILMANNKYAGGYREDDNPLTTYLSNFVSTYNAAIKGQSTSFNPSEMELYYSVQKTPVHPTLPVLGYNYELYVTNNEVKDTLDKYNAANFNYNWQKIDLATIIDTGEPRIKEGESPVAKLQLGVYYLDLAKSENNATSVGGVVTVTSMIGESEALYFVELMNGIKTCGQAIPKTKVAELNANYPTWENNLRKYKEELGTKAGVESGVESYIDENGVSQRTKEQLLKDALADEATAQGKVDTANALVDKAQKAVDVAQGEVDIAQDAVDAAKSAVIDAQRAVLTAQDAVGTAKAAVTTAENEVTAANEYKKLTITGDNEFVVTETLADEWPADGVLRGNGNKIVNDVNTPLFGHNYGSVSNLIAPNGSIASYIEAGAQVRACIVKTSSTEKPYRAYDDNGASNEYFTLPEAVYSMRGYFGYDAQNATATGKVASDTKLYKAQNKVASDTPMTDVYVNILGAGDVKYNAGSVSTVNTLLYLDDSAVTEDNKTVTAPNVAVLESAVTDAETGEVFKAYSCAKVQLVDGSANPEFYMPYSVKADELSYLRKTTTNKVPVCMPFELNADIKALIAKNVGTDASNVFYYTLNEVKDGVVWFTPQASIGANKPGLIAFKEDVKLDGEKNIFAGLGTMEVSATPQIADLSAKPLNGGDEAFFGNYKPGQISSVLLQAHTGAGNAAYCYQGGQLVRMKEDASGSTKLNQFRSYVIMKEDAASPHSLPDSFEIGFQDEDGNEVTGIGTVESGMSDNGFKAVGGSGVIAITAEKACEVKVYTAGGSLVKAVRVEAGSTKLPFSAGMYIVNQTKVVVK